MKQIILVRHGQAENNLHKLIGGWSNVKLTELGIQQAQAVAIRLEKELKGTIKIYSSDLYRAKQTAEIINGKLNKSITYAKGLREHNLGIVSGMALEEAEKYKLKETYPLVEWKPFPESEGWGEFYNRVISFMDKLVEKEERVLIVSHGGTIQNIIKWWLGMSRSDYFKIAFDVRNASVTVLDFNIHEVNRIERLNDTTHYRSIGLTHPIP